MPRFVGHGRSKHLLSLEIVLTLLLAGIMNISMPIQHVRSASKMLIVPDDYPTVQEAVDHSEAGDKIFVRKGPYFEHVTINKSVFLIGESTEETIIDGKGEPGNVVDLTVDNISFGGFTVKNGGYFLDYSCGIHVKGSNNNVSYNLVAANRGTGIWLEYSSNNTLLNNTIRNNGQKGIWLLYSNYNSLRNNSFVGNSYNVAGGGVNDIDQSNTVNGKPIYYLVEKSDLVIDTQTFPSIGYLAVVNSVNVTVRNLRLSQNGEGLLFSNTSSSRIENCTLVDNYKAAVLAYSNNNTVLGNNVTLDSYGLEFRGSSRNVVAENIISRIDDYGLILVGCSYNRISSNSIKENQYGIMVSNSWGNSILENRITNNSFVSLNLWLAYSSVVVNNVIANGRYGIFQHRGGPQIIYGNDITNNEYYGYQVEEPWCDSMVFNNNFINNSEQAQIYSKFNMTLDSGYPRGGNYWSDYQGLDLCGGVYQNETGSDGIGDVPYVIDQNHMDRYPLMERWESSVPFAFFTYFPFKPWVNESVLFDVSCSYSSCDVVGYEWDFDDGDITTVKESTINHNYCRPARYNVTLRVIVNDTFCISTNQMFVVCYVTDLNVDEKVDIGDITIVAVAFGSRVGDPKYNELADLDKNGVINILDVARVAKDYGKTV